jgi:hypothetical protein
MDMSLEVRNKPVLTDVYFWYVFEDFINASKFSEGSRLKVKNWI